MKYHELCWKVFTEDVWFYHQMMILHAHLNFSNAEIDAKYQRLLKVCGEA